MKENLIFIPQLTKVYVKNTDPDKMKHGNYKIVAEIFMARNINFIDTELSEEAKNLIRDFAFFRNIPKDESLVLEKSFDERFVANLRNMDNVSYEDENGLKYYKYMLEFEYFDYCTNGAELFKRLKHEVHDFEEIETYDPFVNVYVSAILRVQVNFLEGSEVSVVYFDNDEHYQEGIAKTKQFYFELNDILCNFLVDCSGEQISILDNDVEIATINNDRHITYLKDDISPMKKEKIRENAFFFNISFMLKLSFDEVFYNVLQKSNEMPRMGERGINNSVYYLKGFDFNDSYKNFNELFRRLKSKVRDFEFLNTNNMYVFHFFSRSMCLSVSCSEGSVYVFYYDNLEHFDKEREDALKFYKR